MKQNKVSTELANTLGQWWLHNSNDDKGLIDLLTDHDLTLADFCLATGSHEAGIAEWLIQRGAADNILGYNRNDTKWDVYFRREQLQAVVETKEDPRFTIGAKTK